MYKRQPKKDCEMQSLLLSAEDAATLLGIGRSLFSSMHSSGRLGPLPVKLGRRVLWNRKELELWVDVGCPARLQWRNKKVEENEKFC